ncbi:unnamed protein product [Durusdinium trenchii]|uniref:Uncharacterized protein n=1 Tax=Durusdinium trenchii TaxID=1381693 RepID=A0ABP0JVN8_9DINO
MVPASRQERLRQRLLARPPSASAAPKRPKLEETGTPAPEEAEASEFLAAVKRRLMEWGQEEQYHRLVVALSGPMDVKLVVQLLQGHEDLLTVFRRRFAPATWCQGLADSVKEDVFGAGGWAWGSPMRGGLWDILLTFSSFLFHHPGVAKGCRRPQALTEPFQPLQATWGKEDGPFMAPPVDSQDSPDDLPRPPAFPPGQHDADEEELLHEAAIAAAIQHGPQACIRQLVHLLGRHTESTAAFPPSLQRFASQVSRSAREKAPELVILRGLPGIGKSAYALETLRSMRPFEAEEEALAQMVHICAQEEFLKAYRGEEAQLEKALQRNELRALLAMEAQIDPVFIDCPNLRLWEMKPYLLLAERLGYEVHVVEPWEICTKHSDLGFLSSVHRTAARRERRTMLSPRQLQGFLKAFEALPTDEPLEAIRRAPSGAGQFVR